MPPGRAALVIWGFVLGPFLSFAVGFAGVVIADAVWPVALVVVASALSTALVGLCLRRSVAKWQR